MLFPQAAIKRQVLWLVVLCACLRPAAGLADSPVRIAGVTYLGDLPTLIAEQHSLFEQEGIDVRVDYGPSGKVNLERLRKDEVDYALMALTPLVIDRLSDPTPGKRDDPVILASLVHSTRLNQVVTVAGRGVDSVTDLAGRRIALSRGTNTEFLWWLFAQYNEMNPGEVTLLDRPINQIPQALINGEVDAAITWEPWTARLRARLGDRLRIFAHSNIYTAKWVVVTKQRTARQHPKRSSRLLAAYQAAIKYIERQPEQALRLYADNVDIAISQLPAWKQILNYQMGLDWSLISTLQQQFIWARQAGYPVVEPADNILSLIDSGPLQLTGPRLVDIPVGADNK